MKISLPKILPIFILLIFNSCDYNKNLNGNWAILEIYYGENEISGNSSRTYLTPSMEISGSRISIDFHEKKPNLYGRLNYQKREGQEFVIISGFADNRLNDKYNLHLELTRGTKTSRYKEFEMILQSDSIYIRAIRSFAKLL